MPQHIRWHPVDACERHPYPTEQFQMITSLTAAAKGAHLTVDDTRSEILIVFTGPWVNTTISPVYEVLTNLNVRAGTSAKLDLSGITSLDTGGAWLIRRLMTTLEGKALPVALSDARPGMIELISALPAKLPEPEVEGHKQTVFQRLFAPLGETISGLGSDGIDAMNIIGSVVRGSRLNVGRLGGLSPAAVFSQLQQMAVNAVPIVALMSFLIGAIIAQQGAFQLRYFGAELFVVDLVGILQLREIGVLLTAIMIAGRSGSAITAEIGSMKMGEEIDALQVMGLSPVSVLIFPRLLALTIALPLLTIIANFAALGGAAVVAYFYSGITFDVFLSRLQMAIEIPTLVSGMIKAPFMAIVIGVVASVEGLKVGGSAESLGQHVTASVVKAIFVVILLDGLFAIFYAAIDF